MYIYIYIYIHTHIEGIGEKGVLGANKYKFGSGDHYRIRIWAENRQDPFYTDPFYIPWTLQED